MQTGKEKGVDTIENLSMKKLPKLKTPLHAKKKKKDQQIADRKTVT
jgi:hypothetical protein